MHCTFSLFVVLGRCKQPVCDSAGSMIDDTLAEFTASGCTLTFARHCFAVNRVLQGCVSFVLAELPGSLTQLSAIQAARGSYSCQLHLTATVQNTIQRWLHTVVASGACGLIQGMMYWWQRRRSTKREFIAWSQSRACWGTVDWYRRASIRGRLIKVFLSAKLALLRFATCGLLCVTLRAAQARCWRLLRRY